MHLTFRTTRSENITIKFIFAIKLISDVEMKNRFLAENKLCEWNEFIFFSQSYCDMQCVWVSASPQKLSHRKQQPMSYLQRYILKVEKGHFPNQPKILRLCLIGWVKARGGRGWIYVYYATLLIEPFNLLEKYIYELNNKSVHAGASRLLFACVVIIIMLEW